MTETFCTATAHKKITEQPVKFLCSVKSELRSTLHLVKVGNTLHPAAVQIIPVANPLQNLQDFRVQIEDPNGVQIRNTGGRKLVLLPVVRVQLDGTLMRSADRNLRSFHLVSAVLRNTQELDPTERVEQLLQLFRDPTKRCSSLVSWLIQLDGEKEVLKLRMGRGLFQDSNELKEIVLNPAEHSEKLIRILVDNFHSLFFLEAGLYRCLTPLEMLEHTDWRSGMCFLPSNPQLLQATSLMDQKNCIVLPFGESLLLHPAESNNVRLYKKDLFHQLELTEFVFARGFPHWMGSLDGKSFWLAHVQVFRPGIIKLKRFDLQLEKFDPEYLNFQCPYLPGFAIAPVQGKDNDLILLLTTKGSLSLQVVFRSSRGVYELADPFLIPSTYISLDSNSQLKNSISCVSTGSHLLVMISTEVWSREGDLKLKSYHFEITSDKAYSQGKKNISVIEAETDVSLAAPEIETHPSLELSRPRYIQLGIKLCAWFEVNKDMFCVKHPAIKRVMDGVCVYWWHTNRRFKMRFWDPTVVESNQGLQYNPEGCFLNLGDSPTAPITMCEPVFRKHVSQLIVSSPRTDGNGSWLRISEIRIEIAYSCLKQSIALIKA